MFCSINKKILAISGFAALFTVWAIVYLAGVYNALLIPSPIEVIKTLGALFVSKEFLLNLLATFTRVIIAFIISTVIGVVLGLIFGYYKNTDISTASLIDFIRSIPGIAVFPLFILLFGIGEISRLLVAIFVAIPIILINTKYGVINSSKMRKNLCKIYKIKKFDMFRRVILPEASPYIFTGLKVALSFAIIIIIVTEMLLGTTYGLGQLLITGQYEFNTPLIYSIIIVLGMVGFLMNYAFNKIETKVFHWR
jgi:ABC-type nitrate/sulfonate/bicarbonate transport system permease component